jgi:lambda family phage portal protein
MPVEFAVLSGSSSDMKTIKINKVADVTGRPTQHAMGGGLEGADRTSRETALWSPSLRSPDALINPLKRQADARGRDMVQNDGFAQGAGQFHRDAIVGAQYRLNARPNWKVIGASEGWAEEFQTVVEDLFQLYADSPNNYFDMGQMNTFTGMIRMGVLGFLKTGEVISTAEWDRTAGRPYKTCAQMISSDRLSNPDLQADSDSLRRGIQYDSLGRPQGYWIQVAHPGDTFMMNKSMFTWKYIPIRKPWGRKQVIHIIEQQEPDQSRGIADMVAALKNMRMTKKFQEVTLQNAVVNASYAAAIESELPPELVIQQMGGGNTDMSAILGKYLEMMGAYFGASTNVQIDGAKIPTLFPGTKLNLKPMGTPGGVGTDFEMSLLRHTAAALGLQYEEFSRDYSRSNYSSIQAGGAVTRRFMEGRKKMVADRQATEYFMLWLEEAIAAGDVPLPKGMRRDIFYKPLMKEAFSKCDWVGASQGQIDQLKETQAAMLRIKAGLSTYEKEIARLGGDYREFFQQMAREQGMIKELNLTFALDASKSNAPTQDTLQNDTQTQDEPTTAGA